MKVHNYIYQEFKERGMKSFELKVKKLLKTNNVKAENIICHNAFMERANGRGSYNNVCEIEIDKNIYHLRDHTNDSLAWDNFIATTKNKRNLFLAVLENKIEILKELIQENQE